MYVRLAFAVAAHLEPEILIVDEVLAVGDAAFQQKCLGKMGEVAKEGRTVLFVSHNMATVQSLCNRAILLENGLIVSNGVTDEVIRKYAQTWTEIMHSSLRNRTDRRGNGKLRFIEIYFEDVSRNRCPVAISGQELHIVCCFQAKEFLSINNVIFSVALESITGEKLLLFRSNHTGDVFQNIPLKGASICTIPRFPLIQGTYRITVYAESAGEILDWVLSASELQVIEGDFFGTGKLQSRKFGQFLVDHSWRVCNIE
jgi:lipopolysaccharide transport system ATP-binding protein